MGNAFKPSVEVIIGGEPHRLVMGFGEVIEFENLAGESFMEAFSGMPKISSVVKFVSVGLRWKLGRKGASERAIAKKLDKDPTEFLPIIDAIGKLAVKFFPQPSDSDDERPLGDQNSEDERSTGTSS